MSDLVVDSSVVAKWVLPEVDSDKAQQLIVQAADSGDRLIALDLVFPEVANAIWKRQRQQLIQFDEARALLEALVNSPIEVEPAVSLLASAYEIAAQYDREKC
jgi:predicted nucleic acid-binding protein